MKTMDMKPMTEKDKMGGMEPANEADSMGEMETPIAVEVNIPIDPEWVKDLKGGAKVVFTLSGTIRRVKIVDPQKKWDRNEATVEVTKVEFNDKTEYSELLDA